MSRRLVNPFAIVGCIVVGLAIPFLIVGCLLLTSCAYAEESAVVGTGVLICAVTIALFEIAYRVNEMIEEWRGRRD